MAKSPWVALRPFSLHTTPRYAMGLWNLCIAVLLLLPGCTEREPPEEPIPPVVIEEAEAEDSPPPRHTITQAEFDKLLYDTPYADVVDHFRMDPSRQESTYNEGVDGYTGPSVISWYIWENPDGSFVKLGFTEKRLTDKQSEELPSE